MSSTCKLFVSREGKVSTCNGTLPCSEIHTDEKDVNSKFDLLPKSNTDLNKKSTEPSTSIKIEEKKPVVKHVPKPNSYNADIKGLSDKQNSFIACSLLYPKLNETARFLTSNRIQETIDLYSSLKSEITDPKLADKVYRTCEAILLNVISLTTYIHDNVPKETIIREVVREIFVPMVPKISYEIQQYLGDDTIYRIKERRRGWGEDD